MLNCEKWETYPKEIVSAQEVWGLNQSGEMKTFDEAFTWTRPKTLSKQEHLKKFLLHLNESKQFRSRRWLHLLGSSMAKELFLFTSLFQIQNSSDLPKGEPFFVIVKDKWGNESYQ